MKITDISARPVPDSRGKETLEVTVCSGDLVAVSHVPSGKSTGTHEALELRDEEGSVAPALNAIRDEIRPALLGQEVDQLGIDKALIDLDGTKHKTRLGGNSLIGVSMAVARLEALIHNVPLWKSVATHTKSNPAFPRLYMNMINGGVHADFRLPFQEYILSIEGKPSEAYMKGVSMFEELGGTIRSTYGNVLMGDEGGYSPQISDNIETPFELLKNVIKEKGVRIAIDAAASEFYHDGSYSLLGKSYTKQELSQVYIDLIHKYPFVTIEDPFAEDDIEGFSNLQKLLPNDIRIVGDDLTVTNAERIIQVENAKAARAVIIKPNQVGTISETYEAIHVAKSFGWEVIVSHRSGDTLGTFISDLAVGIGAYGIKAGSPLVPERKVKYERLIAIEREMEV